MIDVKVTDQNGQIWRLAGALQQGAVVLVFYRGDW
jgi:peroxiredoxin